MGRFSFVDDLVKPFARKAGHNFARSRFGKACVQAIRNPKSVLQSSQQFGRWMAGEGNENIIRKADLEKRIRETLEARARDAVANTKKNAKRVTDQMVEQEITRLGYRAEQAGPPLIRVFNPVLRFFGRPGPMRELYVHGRNSNVFMARVRGNLNAILRGESIAYQAGYRLLVDGNIQLAKHLSRATINVVASPFKYGAQALSWGLKKLNINHSIHTYLANARPGRVLDPIFDQMALGSGRLRQFWMMDSGAVSTNVAAMVGRKATLGGLAWGIGEAIGADDENSLPKPMSVLRYEFAAIRDKMGSLGQGLSQMAEDDGKFAQPGDEHKTMLAQFSSMLSFKKMRDGLNDMDVPGWLSTGLAGVGTVLALPLKGALNLADTSVGRKVMGWLGWGLEGVGTTPYRDVWNPQVMAFSDATDAYKALDTHNQFIAEYSKELAQEMTKNNPILTPEDEVLVEMLAQGAGKNLVDGFLSGGATNKSAMNSGNYILDISQDDLKDYMRASVLLYTQMQSIRAVTNPDNRQAAATFASKLMARDMHLVYDAASDGIDVDFAERKQSSLEKTMQTTGMAADFIAGGFISSFVMPLFSKDAPAPKTGSKNVVIANGSGTVSMELATNPEGSIGERVRGNITQDQARINQLKAEHAKWSQLAATELDQQKRKDYQRRADAILKEEYSADLKKVTQTGSLVTAQENLKKKVHDEVNGYLSFADAPKFITKEELERSRKDFADIIATVSRISAKVDAPDANLYKLMMSQCMLVDEQLHRQQDIQNFAGIPYKILQESGALPVTIRSILSDQHSVKDPEERKYNELVEWYGIEQKQLVAQLEEAEAQMSQLRAQAEQQITAIVQQYGVTEKRAEELVMQQLQPQIQQYKAFDAMVNARLSQIEKEMPVFGKTTPLRKEIAELTQKRQSYAILINMKRDADANPSTDEKPNIYRVKLQQTLLQMGLDPQQGVDIAKYQDEIWQIDEKLTQKKREVAQAEEEDRKARRERL